MSQNLTIIITQDTKQTTLPITMKFSLPLVLLSAFAATTKADTVQVSDFLVDKHEDAITRAVKVRSVSFTLDGYEASSVNCAASPPPTFPSDILKCDDPNYRFVITEGEEGSGLQFAVQVYYDNQATG